MSYIYKLLTACHWVVSRIYIWIFNEHFMNKMFMKNFLDKFSWQIHENCSWKVHQPIVPFVVQEHSWTVQEHHEKFDGQFMNWCQWTNMNCSWIFMNNSWSSHRGNNFTGSSFLWACGCGTELLHQITYWGLPRSVKIKRFQLDAEFVFVHVPSLQGAEFVCTLEM